MNLLYKIIYLFAFVLFGGFVKLIFNKKILNLNRQPDNSNWQEVHTKNKKTSTQDDHMPPYTNYPLF